MNTSQNFRQHHIIDAKGQTLGRIASRAAHLLSGKHKTNYAPNADSGDFVDVINFNKVKFSGRKSEQKTYFRHSGYVGSLKKMSLSDMMAKDQKKVLTLAVKRMLADNKLRAGRMKDLT